MLEMQIVAMAPENILKTHAGSTEEFTRME